jgi:hypothetical protein
MKRGCAIPRRLAEAIVPGISRAPSPTARIASASIELASASSTTPPATRPNRAHASLNATALRWPRAAPRIRAWVPSSAARAYLVLVEAGRKLGRAGAGSSFGGSSSSRSAAGTNGGRSAPAGRLAYARPFGWMLGPTTT